MDKTSATRRLAALLFAGAAAPAAACDFCLISQGISPLETLRGAGLRLTQRYALNDSVYRGSDEIANPGAQEEFWTTDLTGFFSLAEGLTFIVNVPVRVTRLDGHVHVHEDGEVEAHADKGGDEGLGDVSVLARYTFFNRHTLDSTTQLAVTAGVKVPTGATDERTDDGEDFLDAHTQLGTGSLDALLGASGNYTRGRFGLAANVLGAITTEGEVGDQVHAFGDWINYDLAARYRLAPGTMGASPVQTFVSFGVSGEARNKETLNGVTDPNSGGHTVYLTPGLQVNLGAHWVAEFRYQHAIHHDFNGVQLGEDYKVFGSLTYLR